jgi:hydroxyacylglutathione hydrolase
MMDMLLRVQAVGPWRMNANALACPVTMQSVLIDPGDEPHALDALLEGTRPVAILITHFHPDHIGALKVMRARLQVPVMAHTIKTESKLWQESSFGE